MSTAQNSRIAPHAIKEFPLVFSDYSIGDVERQLTQRIGEFETINYIYVNDRKGQLVGVLSIKELFRNPKDRLLETVMTRNLVTVDDSTTPERAAYLALKHKLKEMPIVDLQGKITGIIPNHKILSVVYRESRDLLMRKAGIVPTGDYSDDILSIPWWVAIEHRLPWLLIGLFGGLGAAKIIDMFELTLQRNLLLASFIPLIVYMSDAVGTQMEAFIIRDTALNPKLDFKKYFLKQTTILTGIAALFSLILYGASYFLYHDLRISFTLFAALFCAIISSIVTGLFIPHIFGRFKMDAANASGPIATIIQDLLSVLIYFTIASLVIR